jgi:hypothetical protein
MAGWDGCGSRSLVLRSRQLSALSSDTASSGTFFGINGHRDGPRLRILDARSWRHSRRALARETQHATFKQLVQRGGGFLLGFLCFLL